MALRFITVLSKIAFFVTTLQRTQNYLKEYSQLMEVSMHYSDCGKEELNWYCQPIFKTISLQSRI